MKEPSCRMFTQSVLLLVLVLMAAAIVHADESPVTVGEAPENEGGMISESVAGMVNRPGEWRIGVALDYGFVERSAERTRLLGSTVDVAYGLVDNLTLEGRAGASVSQTTTLAADESGESQVGDTDYNNGLSDLAAGLSYQIFDEGSRRPAVTLHGEVMPPTGTRREAEAGIGFDYWRYSAGASALRTYDYINQFVRLDVEVPHRSTAASDRTISGTRYEVSSGTSFSVSDRLSLNARISGTYQAEQAVDGDDVDGTDSESYNLALGTTRSWNRDTSITTMASFDMTAPHAAGIMVRIDFTGD
ncbi:MAG: transporter [Natronospirillum sp.]|uniref:transporter n=1 Tax=Natronospirillum sp. TaxID=2812955 RepID=UPI0025CD205F|nr:transporter [Natronospirillum sp.]MCH8550434.1 transporter [Natronospirillum sp.]